MLYELVNHNTPYPLYNPLLDKFSATDPLSKNRLQKTILFLYGSFLFQQTTKRSTNEPVIEYIQKTLQSSYQRTLGTLPPHAYSRVGVGVSLGLTYLFRSN